MSSRIEVLTSSPRPLFSECLLCFGEIFDNDPDPDPDFVIGQIPVNDAKILCRLFGLGHQNVQTQRDTEEQGEDNKFCELFQCATYCSNCIQEIQEIGINFRKLTELEVLLGNSKRRIEDKLKCLEVNENVKKRGEKEKSVNGHLNKYIRSEIFPQLSSTTSKTNFSRWTTCSTVSTQSTGTTGSSTSTTAAVEPNIESILPDDDDNDNVDNLENVTTEEGFGVEFNELPTSTSPVPSFRLDDFLEEVEEKFIPPDDPLDLPELNTLGTELPLETRKSQQEDEIQKLTNDDLRQKTTRVLKVSLERLDSGKMQTRFSKRRKLQELKKVTADHESEADIKPDVESLKRKPQKFSMFKIWKKNKLNYKSKPAIATRTKCTFDGCTITFGVWDDEKRKCHVRRVHEGMNHYVCSICNETFKWRSQWKSHISKHGSTKSTNSCKYCQVECPSKYSLKLHIYSVHEVEKIKFKCEICGKAFLHRTLYDKHIPVHTKEKAFMCEICSAAFKTKALLKYHQMSKHEESNLCTCKICGKILNSPINLRGHMKRVHMKEFKVQCEICGHGALSKSELDTHFLRLHSNEKPHKCHLCPAAYKIKDGLDSHMRIHTGERPYKCRTCGKGFIRGGCRNRHELIHSQSQRHECKVCGKVFPLHNYLYVHMKSHNKTNRKRDKNDDERMESNLDTQTEVFEEIVEHEIPLSSSLNPTELILTNTMTFM